jgi:hypothetical protein
MYIFFVRNVRSCHFLVDTAKYFSKLIIILWFYWKYMRDSIISLYLYQHQLIVGAVFHLFCFHNFFHSDLFLIVVLKNGNSVLWIFLLWLRLPEHRKVVEPYCSMDLYFNWLEKVTKKGYPFWVEEVGILQGTQTLQTNNVYFPLLWLYHSLTVRIGSVSFHCH